MKAKKSKKIKFFLLIVAVLEVVGVVAVLEVVGVVALLEVVGVVAVY